MRPPRQARVAQPAHLLDARVAAGEVALKTRPLTIVERVQRIGTGQCVQRVGTATEVHQSTPRQSRNLIRPSRIRVFTVPRATPSNPATC